MIGKSYPWRNMWFNTIVMLKFMILHYDFYLVQ